MEEIVDQVLEAVEKMLEYNGISLEVSELDEVRDTLDDVLLKYDEEE